MVAMSEGKMLGGRLVRMDAKDHLTIE